MGAYESAVAGCKHEELMVPVKEGEGGQVRVLLHTPAHLPESSTKAGLVYAHGGAVLSGSAHLYKPHLSLLAINLGIPVFNVDYRQLLLFCSSNNHSDPGPGWPQSQSAPSRQ